MKVGQRHLYNPSKNFRLTAVRIICLLGGVQFLHSASLKDFLLSPSRYSIEAAFALETSGVPGGTNFYFGRWQTDAFYIQGPSPTPISSIADHRQMPVAGRSGKLIWYADALGVHTSEIAGTLGQSVAANNPVAMNVSDRLLLFQPVVRGGILPMVQGSIFTNDHGNLAASSSVFTNSILELAFEESETGLLDSVAYSILIQGEKAEYRVDYLYDAASVSGFPSMYSTHYVAGSSVELIQDLRILSLKLDDSHLALSHFLPDSVLSTEVGDLGSPSFSTVHSNGVSFFVNASGDLEQIEGSGRFFGNRGAIVIFAMAVVVLLLGAMIRRKLSNSGEVRT